MKKSLKIFMALALAVFMILGTVPVHTVRAEEPVATETAGEEPQEKDQTDQAEEPKRTLKDLALLPRRRKKEKRKKSFLPRHSLPILQKKIISRKKRLRLQQKEKKRLFLKNRKKDDEEAEEA